MSQQTAEDILDWRAAVENLVTEDDEPVDNFLSATLMRLLVTPLYDSWTPPPSEEAPGEKRRFMATANVGVFRTPYEPPVVPDMLLSLDIETPHDWSARDKRSYFLWEFGKPPDVVVEIVSNTKGRELDEKLRHYARLDVSYYVVYDPHHWLMEDPLRVYERGFGRRYRRRGDYNLPDVGLSLTLWEGVYEGEQGNWLRWLDSQGNLIPTGAECTTQASECTTQASERATQAEDRAAKLAAKLRELGIDPDEM
ncbi:MAG TPA: Uma2 family endonuclease [Blastocatellia bacterium]|nr:Uma2 family endonuclease [Blastocatellia bacterium]